MSAKLTAKQCEASESQVMYLLDRIAGASDSCPMNNIRMWARQARDLLEHGEVLSNYDRERLALAAPKAAK